MGVKYYVVWSGKIPGIYTSWDDCKANVHGVEGAKYKAFKSKDEAESAFADKHYTFPKKAATSSPAPMDNPPFVYPSISVDAACSGNPGVMEYKGVDTKTGKELFRPAPIQKGTNNIGEFLAIVHGLAYLQKAKSEIPIYTDSRTALAWIKNAKAKTSLVKDDSTAEIWGLIERAEDWLRRNSYSNPLLKWDTENWGEIPADFGRK